MTEAYADALARLAAKNGLSGDCLIVMERLGSVQIELDSRFERCDVRRYGDTAVDFVRLKEA